MIDEEIVEGDKIIDEFMRDYDLYHLGRDSINEFRKPSYCEDWNYLIPVVQKICGTRFNNKNGDSFRVTVSISEGHTTFYKTNWSIDESNILSSRCSGEKMIEHCWLAILDCIKYYNQNKKNDFAETNSNI